ncbi:CdaR family protein [Geojedonia litorea]|uniref:CdaR family protein n=1 Tax=Geojedonia litorea TaxID=1268269 RepID=A0ABV9N567_9FLAO
MSNSVKSKFVKSIKNKKLHVFGLFFLFAFLFLLLSKLSKTYTEDIPVAINFINLPQNQVIVTDSSPVMNATVSAYGFNLLIYQFRKHTIAVDFSKDVYKQNNNYVWVPNKYKHKINEQLSQFTEIILIEPDTLYFPVETLSSKKVPIVLNESIKFKSGYNILNGYKIEPDSVNVIGSEQEISKVKSVETLALNLTDVSTNIDVKLPLKQFNSKLKYSIDETSVRANVEKFTEGTIEIPVTIVNKPLGVEVNYFPKVITIAYNVSLDNYKNVKPLDFKVECDYLEIEQSNKTYFTPKLVKVSPIVKNVKLKQNKVEFILIQ